MAKKPKPKTIEQELEEMQPVPAGTTGTRGWFGEMESKAPEQFTELKKHITVWVSDTAGKSLIRQKLGSYKALYGFMLPKIESVIGRRPSPESFYDYVKKVEASLG